MPDLLTHVLVGYSIGTLLSVRYERIRAPQVTLVMAGALSPDLRKIALVSPNSILQTVTGSPVSWTPLHTLGGSLLVVVLGSLLVAPEYRRQAIALTTIGAVSHHAFDVALFTITGEAYAVFFPMSTYRPPSLDLYLSTDRWPAAVAGVLAVVVWTVRRYSTAGPQETSS
ncbi:metal-dependent hydrolase [Haloarchaeobius amylolyticus]|uniref:Metal-dependent hydrolase n=1 Tax=Haloarchaeobius amylolyticus TaxID=1198296 RepID=A0ABD6BHU4_9EURY